LEIFLLWSIGGLSVFDAINHGLTTMPSGGFSTHDASIGFYDSAIVETIIIVFMLLAGINFTLIWFAWEGQWKKSFGDEEGRFFIGMITVITLFITTVLYASDSSDSGFRDAVFTVVSIGTSTGYVITDYGIWPVVTHVLIILLMVVGGCAGSTAGGLKVLRINLAFKVALREIGRITQPRKVQRIRMNGEVVQRERLGMIIGMLFVWIMLFSLACIALALFMPGSDFETIFSVVAASLGNTGPALGSYGPSTTWAEMNSGALITTSALMWFGRLELLTALLLLHPNTWKREKRDAPDRNSIKLFRNIFSKR
jgi:trk system potassium uptake protein TrkH